MTTYVKELLSLADDLLRFDDDQMLFEYAVRRRSVSTAYYAVFHALARCCADELVGDDVRLSREYERVYRALDHGPLRAAFGGSPLKDNPEMREIGVHVVRLQSERHRADYSPDKRVFSRVQCRELIDTAKTVVELLDSLSSLDRRTLSVHLLFKNR